jgi:hypothetical protein
LKKALEDGMTEKPIDIIVGEGISFKESTGTGITIVSTIQAPNQKPIIKTFPITTSSDEIVAGTIRETGIRLEPKKIRILSETIERSKEWGAGFKISANVSAEGSLGFGFERQPSKETKTVIEITYEVKKEDYMHCGAWGQFYAITAITSPTI